MKKYEITETEASIIHMQKFYRSVLPLFIIPILVGILITWMQVWFTLKLIIIMIWIAWIGTLILFWAAKLWSKFISKKVFTMKYELHDDMIITIFPNWKVIEIKYKDIKSIKKWLYATNVNYWFFESMPIFNYRHGHDEIIHFVKEKFNYIHKKIDT